MPQGKGARLSLITTPEGAPGRGPAAGPGSGRAAGALRYSAAMTKPDTPSASPAPDTPEDESVRKIHGDLKDMLGQLARQSPPRPAGPGTGPAPGSDPASRLH